MRFHGACGVRFSGGLATVARSVCPQAMRRKQWSTVRRKPFASRRSIGMSKPRRRPRSTRRTAPPFSKGRAACRIRAYLGGKSREDGGRPSRSNATDEALRRGGQQQRTEWAVHGPVGNVEQALSLGSLDRRS
jgi:hypothetical protein